MNVAEKLARELVRVTKLRRAYEDIGPPGAFAVAMLDAALEVGCLDDTGMTTMFKHLTEAKAKAKAVATLFGHKNFEG